MSDILEQEKVMIGVMSKILDRTDKLPLGAWLVSFDHAFAYSGGRMECTLELRKLFIRKFVDGMHRRGLAYHWEDDAHDCLDGKVSVYEGNVINRLASELHEEYLFSYSLEVLNAGV